MTDVNLAKKITVVSAVVASLVVISSYIWWSSKKRGASQRTTKDFINDEDKIAIAIERRNNGNSLFNAGRFEEAIISYGEAIDLCPKDHPEQCLAYSNRSAAYFSLKKYDSSLEDCNSALSIEPKFIKALNRRARLFEVSNKNDDALVDAVAAVVIDDFKTESLFIHVETLLKKISETQAKSILNFQSDLTNRSPWYLRSFLRTFPREWQFILEAAKSNDNILSVFFEYITENKFSEAYSFIKELLKNVDHEDNIHVLNWIGTLHYLAGDFSSALKVFQHCLSLDSTLASARIKLALVYLEFGMYRQMTDELDLVTKIDDTDPALYFHRGEILALSNNMDSAIADFLRAVQLDPEFIEAYVRISRAYLSSGDSKNAEIFLHKALGLFPETPELIHALGECKAVNNEQEQALELFESVSNLSPDFPEVFLNQALLKHQMKVDTVEDLISNLEKILVRFPHFDAAHIQLATFLISQSRIVPALKHFDLAAMHARTFQEKVAIFSMKEISRAQFEVARKFPELAESLRSRFISESR